MGEEGAGGAQAPVGETMDNYVTSGAFTWLFDALDENPSSNELNARSQEVIKETAHAEAAKWSQRGARQIQGRTEGRKQQMVIDRQRTVMQENAREMQEKRKAEAEASRPLPLNGKFDPDVQAVQAAQVAMGLEEGDQMLF